MESQSDIEIETYKELEKTFFKEGIYYSIDPARRNYKGHPLYKCTHSSPYGALLQAFNETGAQVSECYVPHGAKRYILSDQNEESIRKNHYNNFLGEMREEVKKHEDLAIKLKKEIELAELHLSTWD